MLEVLASDGRGRVARWSPSEGSTLHAPQLIIPETTFAPVPIWAEAVVTSQARGRKQPIEIVSGGTWFYPNPTDAGNGLIIVPTVRPAPTTEIQLINVGAELAVLHDAGGWASNPKKMVAALAKARKDATPARLLWAPALGTPQDYALWVYLGVDLFDASPLLLAASRGQVLTTDGTLTAEEAGRLLGEGAPWTTTQITQHNLDAARRELALVRHHIERGTLRGLVERRIYSSPASVELLRRFDREHTYLEAAAPRHRTVALPAMTADSLWMPEVEAFRRAFRDHYEPPRSAKVLVLMPCSQRKPYKLSRSHKFFGRALDDSGIRDSLHEVMITSPLGLVPRELEEVYPANQYDIPVTGHWMRDEEAVVREQLAALLSKQEYSHVVVHLGQATFDVLRDLLPENTRHTALHHPTSQEDCERLKQELLRVKAELPAGNGREFGSRWLHNIRALASFQFGAAVADDLVDGAQVHGRMPFLKLERAGRQLATTTPDRGVLSLTLEGAQVLARNGRKRVFIGDFVPKATSTLFAVGVEKADADVRAGDEVVVMHKDEVRGCGVAKMSAEEMTHLKRGVAVALRHTVNAKPVAPVAPEVLA